MDKLLPVDLAIPTTHPDVSKPETHSSPSSPLVAVKPLFAVKLPRQRRPSWNKTKRGRVANETMTHRFPCRPHRLAAVALSCRTTEPSAAFLSTAAGYKKQTGYFDPNSMGGAIDDEFSWSVPNSNIKSGENLKLSSEELSYHHHHQTNQNGHHEEDAAAVAAMDFELYNHLSLDICNNNTHLMQQVIHDVHDVNFVYDVIRSVSDLRMR